MLKKALWILLITFLMWTPTPNDSPLGNDRVHASQDPPTLNLRSQNEALVTGIRYWSNSSYTRIVIDLDNEVTYTDHLLKEDVVLKKPPRLFLDLKVAKLSHLLTEPIPIENEHLKRARAGQYSSDTVRVVLDLESITDYKIFSLTDPFRIVIDIFGKFSKEKSKEVVISSGKMPSQITLVIDPGHGGEDPGAIGPKGLKEKDVVLKIAQKVRAKVWKELGWKVVMTREEDVFLPLEERTAIANTNGGSLFLSIHANASRNNRVHGIETYFLNYTNDKDALRLAAKESGVAPEKISDLQLILYDLMLNAKGNESSQLAEYIQKAMVGTLQKRYNRVKNLGVKHGPFVVLFGAKMPSILLEVSFISNPLEERRLRNEKYLDDMASSIVEGLKRYATGIKVTKGVQPSWSISTAFSSN